MFIKHAPPLPPKPKKTLDPPSQKQQPKKPIYLKFNMPIPDTPFYSSCFSKEVTKGNNILCILERTYSSFVIVSYNFILTLWFIRSKTAEKDEHG